MLSSRSASALMRNGALRWFRSSASVLNKQPNNTKNNKNQNNKNQNNKKPGAKKGKGPGDAGGWPSTTGNKSGGGRSNNPQGSN